MSTAQTISFDYEIVSSRTFNASQETVFRAWTEPEHLKVWWGPNGFTNTFNEFDLRPGGTWSFVMHGPEGGNYHNKVKFEKIEAPHLLSWQRISKPLFRVQTTFEKISAVETKVVFRMIFDTPEERQKLIAFVPEKNEENFDRLEAELRNMITVKN